MEGMYHAAALHHSCIVPTHVAGSALLDSPSWSHPSTAHEARHTACTDQEIDIEHRTVLIVSAEKSRILWYFQRLVPTPRCKSRHAISYSSHHASLPSTYIKESGHLAL